MDETHQVRILDLHSKAPLIDLHADTFSSARRTTNFLDGWPKKHLDLPRMFDCGLWAEAFSLFVYPRWGGGQSSRWLEVANRELANIELAVEASDGRFAIARNSAEILQNKENGSVSAIIEIEGLHSLGGDLELIDSFFERGVRIFTLTWNNSNEWATSCMDSKAQTVGLTADGRTAVERIDKLGGLIDFSHSGERTFWDAMEIITRPPICTHSCCSSLKDSPRNLTDEQISAIIDKAGIIGINFYPGFLSSKETEHVTAADIVNHIEHILSFDGEENVGLGSDFDGIRYLPADMSDCTGLSNVTREMINRGFPENRILKILGSNFLRVFS
ncbi:MAG TPA: membrane dipeptidase [candidate division Zixibacteria bacterium]|nr:membrane dipeptidase [candidate division Zixibacteria bacterium]